MTETLVTEPSPVPRHPACGELCAAPSEMDCECSACCVCMGVCLLDLQDELDVLERTDPKVAAAAASYDAMVRRLTGRAT